MPRHRPLPAPAPAVAPTPAGDSPAPAPAAAPTTAGDFPPSLAKAHPDDQAVLASVVSQCVERNTGAMAGTGSGPTDLSGAIENAVATDVADWSEDSPTPEDLPENEEPTGGRAPTEANGGLEDLPENVTMNEMAFLVRQRPRQTPEEPRVDISLVKQLGWTLQGKEFTRIYKKLQEFIRIDNDLQ